MDLDADLDMDLDVDLDNDLDIDLDLDIHLDIDLDMYAMVHWEVLRIPCRKDKGRETSPTDETTKRLRYEGFRGISHSESGLKLSDKRLKLSGRLLGAYLLNPVLARSDPSRLTDLRTKCYDPSKQATTPNTPNNESDWCL